MHLYIFVGLITTIPLVKVQSQEWSKPYFQPTGENDKIQFGTYNGVYQEISLEEEIPWPFKLAIINYNGDKQPKIGLFNTGNNDLLGGEIIKENNKWYIQINKRQDYENQKQRSYVFDVELSEKEKHTINMNLINIFDCPPTITYDDVCKVEELNSNFTTNCTFHVFDEDGMEKNSITFKFIGKNEEDKVFNLIETGQPNYYQKDYNLTVLKELHYEQRNLYNFKIYAYDIANNNGSLTTTIEVIDMPNMDPKWVKPFVTASFNEKTEQEFKVEAIDGDTGINKPIEYYLEFYENQDYSTLMNINRTSGILHINKIDRDELQQEIFSFKICAYKFDNISWSICDPPAFIIIQDINDHSPEITINPEKVQFLENTFLNVPLHEFIVNDIDLGLHASYNVSLSQNGNILYSKAFDIIPDSGYQKFDFRISVHNATLLDYELDDWREFDLKIIAQELNISTHRTEKNLKIELINWNDELPIFEKDVYNVDVLETIGNNENIINVTATDRDIDDKVQYEIVGTVEGLSINKDNGQVKTTTNRTFDHERQTSVIVQIKAYDTLVTNTTNKTHSVYTQLLINVIDVNDKTPEIRMPRKTPNITENSPGNTLITGEIVATDPDTTAELKFEIDWVNSYATKSGQEAKKSTYENCFYIEPKVETRNKVYGLLKINPNFTKTQEVDYEMYDTLYLTINVTDLNQEVGEPSAEGILTVRVDDVNDNRPIFILDTLNESRNVAEETENGAMIGTIRAIDIDGPPFNIFNYTIRPTEGYVPSTPPNLIEIHNETGVLSVKNGKNIDCDFPKREYLSYTITLNDGIPPNTEGDIKIFINDINNKKPQIEKFDNYVKIWEKSGDGTYVGNINASDLDRDSPHNLLQYSIDFKLTPDFKNFFEIDVKTGKIQVKLLGDSILDRDLGKPKHEIYVNVEDNYMGNGVVNKNDTLLTVILLDINDHAPELPKPKDFQPVIKENAIKDTKIIDIKAKDIDEPNTPNSWVSYKILGIKPSDDIEVQNLDPNYYSNLFRIEGNDNETGHIYVNKELKGYYGKWSVNVEAYDHGDEGPSNIIMRNQEIYSFAVKPFNFHNPKIIYPRPQEVLRLRFRGQEIGSPLLSADGQQLKSFEAYDPDGGDCGNVTFVISSYDSTSDDSQYFEMHKETRTRSRLQIKKEIQPKRYQLNLIAEDEAKDEDGGKKFSEVLKNLIVAFIDMSSQPYFDKNEFNTEFTENKIGLSEKQKIPEAIDPKNDGIENENEKVGVYYFIDSNYNSNDAKLFSLDKTTRILKLGQMLDRKKQKSHKIRIIVTNNIDGPKAQDDNSMLIVYIKVMGPPIFEEQLYGAGISTSDYASKLILSLHADGSTDKLSYLLDKNQILANGENIESIKTKIFNLDSNTGKMTLQEIPTSIMKGYFQFNVTAIDDFNRTDVANVKIYIVSEANRAKFVFYNNYETVVNNTEFLKSSLKNIYGYDLCNIDDISKVTSNQNSSLRAPDEEKTNVRVHFIENNEAIEASEIQLKSSDVGLIEKLKRTLNQQSLYLNDVPQQQSYQNSVYSFQNIYIIALSSLSTILLVGFIGLLVAYVLRVKENNRQIKAFLTPVMNYENNDNHDKKDPSYYNDDYFEKENHSINNDDVKNPTKTLPLTLTNNIFSIEKVNPILNQVGNVMKKNLPEDDTNSIDSENSEFSGIQNDPIFMTSDYMNGINPKIFAKRILNNTLNEDEA